MNLRTRVFEVRCRKAGLVGCFRVTLCRGKIISDVRWVVVEYSSQQTGTPVCPMIWRLMRSELPGVDLVFVHSGRWAFTLL